MGHQSQVAQLVDIAPGTSEFLDAVIAGLSMPQKTIPCKYFYDGEGSRLFEAICETPEYYPTRTERKLLADIAPEIARLVGPGRSIVEFGSGAGVKIRTLLDAFDTPAAYVPVDISRGHLVDAAATLASDYPHIHVAPVCADYTKPFSLPHVGSHDPAWVGFFPGSTIGNFTPPQAAGFLGQVRRMMGAGSFMLIGVDLRKDKAILDAAYNDAAGFTAAFNLNLLVRINDLLDGEWDLDSFAHRAFYNAELGRIEMHLESLRDQTVIVGGHRFAFAQGETIHTENSYKYELEQFQRLAGCAGWWVQSSWTDERRLFSLHLIAAD